MAYRYFISTKKKDLSYLEIQKRMDHIKEVMSKQLPQAEPINSIIEENPPANCAVGVWYAGKSIELLATADLLVYDPRYLTSPGCSIEYDVAWKYGIPRANFSLLDAGANLLKIIETDIWSYDAEKKYWKTIVDYSGDVYG